MFEAIRSGETDRLMTLGTTFYRGGNNSAALLCLDHSFRDFNTQTQVLQSYTDSRIITTATALHSYALLIQEIAIIPDPWARGSIQKLFSFFVQSKRICLPRGTFLHGCSQDFLRHPSSDDIAVEVRFFYHLLRSVLRQRVRMLLHAYCDGCLKVRVFDPCEVSVAGRCERADCTRQHKLDHDWFDKRMGFHLYLIDFSNLLQFFGGDRRYLRFVSKLSQVVSTLTTRSEVSGMSDY